MLRLVVSEVGQGELPAIDVDDAAVVVIGSDVAAHVRLPASAAEPVHVRIEGGRWHAVGLVSVEDVAAKTMVGKASAASSGVAASGAATSGAATSGPASSNSATSGAIGDGVVLVIGTYRVRIAPAPAGVAPTPPQRTESLARELMRSLLGSGAAPSLEVERGPVVGAKRQLPPPESVTIIGRGDEANWILLDEDLSRTHAEVRRGWDGTRIVDLGSKNGTRVDGAVVDAEGVLLHDGVLVELGKVALRFRDPAEKQLGAPAKTATIVAKPAPPPPAAPHPVAPHPVAPPVRASTAPFYLAVAIMVAALAGLVWILSV